MRIACALAIVLALAGCRMEYTPDAGSKPATAPEAGNAPAPKIKLTLGTATEQAKALAAAGALAEAIDAGQRGELWDAASPALQDMATRQQWITMLDTVRGAAGDPQARNLKGIRFTSEMPEAPPGNYAVVFFETTFARATVEEKVVLHDIAGQWRLVGYHVTKSIKLTP